MAGVARYLLLYHSTGSTSLSHVLHRFLNSLHSLLLKASLGFIWTYVHVDGSVKFAGLVISGAQLERRRSYNIRRGGDTRGIEYT